MYPSCDNGWMIIMVVILCLTMDSLLNRVSRAGFPAFSVFRDLSREGERGVMPSCRVLPVVILLVVLVTATLAQAERKKKKSIYDVPNPPIYVAPLGACEVPYLSLKRIKKELFKRGIDCIDCVKKADYQEKLVYAINHYFNVMSDEEYSNLTGEPLPPPPADETGVEGVPEAKASSLREEL